MAYSPPPTPSWDENDVDHQSYCYSKRNSTSSMILPSPGSTTAATTTSPSPSSSSVFGSNSSVSSLRENVQVIVRCRPKSEAEEDKDAQLCWNIKPNAGSIELAKPKLSTSSHIFKFDQVVMGVDNDQIYYPRINDLVKSSMLGYNGTVFAYGQTASGKTYTMMGNEEQPGIIPKAIEDVFTHIEEDTSGREYLLRVSYLEIYNEKIKDLLSIENNDISIIEDKKGIRLRNLTEKKVKSSKEVFDIIKQGEANRHISATDYNQRSSRSHTVFQLVIESRHTGSSTGVQISQLNLIDLAGSEKVASDIERRKEGAYINKSLLTLGTVIHKLTSAKTAQHIPFRNSKLTRILQGALSGNARIAVICTINPTHASKDESLNTLKFAQRTKMMETTARVTNIHDNSELENCLIKIAELQTNLKEKNDSEAATRERLRNLLSLILKSSKTAVGDDTGNSSSGASSGGNNNNSTSNLALMDDDLLNASTIHEVVGRCEETLTAQLKAHSLDMQRMRTQHHQMQAKIRMLEALQAQMADTISKRDSQIDKLNQELLDAKQGIITPASKNITNMSQKVTYSDVAVQCDTPTTLKDTTDTMVVTNAEREKMMIAGENKNTKIATTIDASTQTSNVPRNSRSQQIADDDYPLSAYKDASDESWCLENCSISPTCDINNIKISSSTDEWVNTVSDLAIASNNVGNSTAYDDNTDDLSLTWSSAETTTSDFAVVHTSTINKAQEADHRKQYPAADLNHGNSITKEDFTGYVPYSGSMRQQAPFVLLANRYTVMLILFWFLL